jgi:signal transduction histidine kinase
VACTWRIRHKLWIGLALIFGVNALLLTGPFYGLSVYRACMNSHDSKLQELREAQKLQEKVRELVAADSRIAGGELLEKIQQVGVALDRYSDRLQETLGRGRDPDGGDKELGYVEALKEQVAGLERSVNAEPASGLAIDREAPGVHQQPDVKDRIDYLGSTSNDLLVAIYSNLGERIVQGKAAFRTSLILVVSTSGLGILLVASLLRFFYAWVFDPIRELQHGAGRVAQGDCEHRIEVHSGDEMEDLANAFNDMTDRLRLIYTDLARQVNERSRQLVRSERLASVGFLAAGVAHEINNPLASIAFCSEALEARLAGLIASTSARRALSAENREDREKFESDQEVMTRYLRMIQQEAFRCKEITQRLLEFSRGGERKREPVDLGDLVQDVLEMARHLQNGRGKQIVFDPEGRVVAPVNGQEIKSVVLNLVVNALDSMDEGGRLTIRVGQRDGMAVLEFTDTGCGMTPEVLENIFEPFFTRSRTGKGTGLGLTISHRIISQHGGEIEAASPGVNQGSTFSVRLPLRPAEPAQEESLGHAA